jgi:hypothetical protein
MALGTSWFFSVGCDSGSGASGPASKKLFDGLIEIVDISVSMDIQSCPLTVATTGVNVSFRLQL